MSENPVRDLLDTVSSGAPRLHRVSVNDLVRAGRRRQRRVAASVAGGTAVLVAGAAALTSQTGRIGPTADVGAAGTPSVLATTAQPDPSAEPASAGAAVALVGTINAAHLLANGTQVGTFVATGGCPTTPSLRVVSQGADQVVLALTESTEQPSAALPATAAAGAAPTCGFTGLVNGQSPVRLGSVEVLAELKAALGDRTLVDQATGRAIPYTADTQTAHPTWLPPGWSDSNGVRPVESQTWEQDWSTGANDLLSLRQTFDAPDSLGGAATGAVSGHPARVVVDARSAEVTWWAAGRLYDLAASGTQLCPLPQNSPTLVDCTPASEPTGLPMSVSDLLRVADSVQAP